jgi:hypothetical protein
MILLVSASTLVYLKTKYDTNRPNTQSQQSSSQQSSQSSSQQLSPQYFQQGWNNDLTGNNSNNTNPNLGMNTDPNYYRGISNQAIDQNKLAQYYQSIVNPPESEVVPVDQDEFMQYDNGQDNVRA